MAEPALVAETSGLSNPARRGRHRDLCRLSEVLYFLICKGPGRTEAELAEAAFGRTGLQSRIHFDCRLLESAGRVERRGLGGALDPFTYYPSDRLGE